MKWGWMLFSFVFGILAQLVRAWRWRMLLAPIGERARRRSCEDAVFVSYAASLVVPRSGEVLRCGLLKRADGVSFSKALGTVFTERVVDSLLIVLLTVAAFFWQVPAFKRFLDETGMDLRSFLGRFTETGYLVTIACIVAAVALVLTLFALAVHTIQTGLVVVLGLWGWLSTTYLQKKRIQSNKTFNA